MLGISMVLGYFVFGKRQKIKTPKRPPKNPNIKILPKPVTTDWTKVLTDRLLELDKEKDKIKTRHHMVKFLNKNAKKRKKN